MKSGITLAPNFTSSLLSWYDANRRDLPWRDRNDPYAVLVSEFMLQQTTVPAVIPYYNRWVTRYPTVMALAAADGEEVMRHWEGLGYYLRARNLYAAAREIVREYNGAVPDDPVTLKKLPGIGDYTAAAVASIAFGVRVPALDANNVRVWSRLLASTDRKHIMRAFARILPPDRPGDFNQALMDLGALICFSRTPDCPACPLSSWCRAFHAGNVSEYPGGKSRPDTEHIEAAIGIIVEGEKVLVQKRPETGLLAGLWEFPGGKIKGAETGKDSESRIQNPGGGKKQVGNPQLEAPEEAVVREVREETGLRVQVREKLGVFTHSYTRFNVKLHVFICRRKAGALHNPGAQWVTSAELERLPMPSANRRIVRALEKRLSSINSLRITS